MRKTCVLSNPPITVAGANCDVSLSCGLFGLILEDTNVNMYKAACLQERKSLLKQFENQELFLAIPLI